MWGGTVDATGWWWFPRRARRAQPEGPVRPGAGTADPGPASAAEPGDGDAVRDLEGERVRQLPAPARDLAPGLPAAQPEPRPHRPGAADQPSQLPDVRPGQHGPRLRRCADVTDPGQLRRDGRRRGADPEHPRAPPGDVRGPAGPGQS